MIVNVNPFDTGFDENAHVMRFAAIAKEVTFSAAALVHNPTVQPPPSPSKLPLMNRKNSTTTPSDLAAARAARKQSTSRRRSVVVSLGGGPPKTLEILEEEEDDTTEVEDSYSQTLDDNGQDGQHPMDAFIRELFGEIDELRAQLYDAKMKCATIDAEVRAEVVGQMQETISGMEQNFRRRLQEEVKQQELKMDRKIEMLKMTGTLFRNGSFQQPLAPHQQGEEDEEDEDVQMEEAQDEDEDGYNTEEAGEEDDVEKSLVSRLQMSV
jgi:kinesin family protein 20